jgi:hypothetical protein
VGARGEQLHRVHQRQRLHPVLMLAGEPERRAARGEHDQAGRRAQQLADQRRGRVDHLEVVEQHQRATVAQELLHRRRGRLRAQPEHGAHGVGDELRVGEV